MTSQSCKPARITLNDLLTDVFHCTVAASATPVVCESCGRIIAPPDQHMRWERMTSDGAVLAATVCI